MDRRLSGVLRLAHDGSGLRGRLSCALGLAHGDLGLNRWDESLKSVVSTRSDDQPNENEHSEHRDGQPDNPGQAHRPAPPERRPESASSDGSFGTVLSCLIPWTTERPISEKGTWPPSLRFLIVNSGAKDRGAERMRPQSCNALSMEDAKDPDPREAQIARLEDRLRASVVRLSQAQEQFTLAWERFAQARRALQASQAREGPGPAREADQTEPPGDSP
jgi:hypothetical protein